ncbi:hypothetical protein N7495_005704 [Penicillium taxi]|uniref:uncharacterized protein n=1 Tax=Penicillium taxi TaxID=168475 RepID=UPI0025455F79|nr:uncharacterized protein N7495_005704 [Penicillium taxi]KAJ5894013.1 hypothetical protein N7495_005704 [Penicillium taxi]
MPEYTLSEAVVPNDLILINDRRIDPSSKTEYLLYPAMFRVQTVCGDSTNPSASSVFVQEVLRKRLPTAGYWTMDGPDVRFFNEDEAGDTERDSDSEDCDKDSSLNNNLQKVLDSFENPVKIIVKPHGRDVLKYYYWGHCPECGGSGSFCPGCGGVSRRWPDLFGSCGVDQSCPVCLGYDFAYREKLELRYLEQASDSISYAISALKKPDSSKTIEEVLAMKAEYLLGERERYKLINAQRAEMGMKLHNVEKIVDILDNLEFLCIKNDNVDDTADSDTTGEIVDTAGVVYVSGDVDTAGDSGSGSDTA